MKKWMMAAAAVAGTGLTGGTASAQFFGGPPVGPPGGGMMPAGGMGMGMGMPPGAPAGSGEACAECEDRYGAHPVLKKLMFWKKDGGKVGRAGIGGCKGGNCPTPPPGAPGGPQVGTLVFPNHPFVRSPRDFFMYGQGGS